MPTTTIHIDTIVSGEPGTIEAEVYYLIHQGSRGKRDEYGVPVEPDEDATVEIHSITHKYFDHRLAGIEQIGMCALLDVFQIDAIAESILEGEEEG